MPPVRSTYLDPSRTLEAAVTTVNSSLPPIFTRQARNVLPLEEPHSSILDTTPTLYNERSGIFTQEYVFNSKWNVEGEQDRRGHGEMRKTTQRSTFDFLNLSLSNHSCLMTSSFLLFVDVESWGCWISS